MSPIVIYRIRLPGTKEEEDEERGQRAGGMGDCDGVYGKCHSLHRLRLLGGKECRMGFICTKMEGDSCGDYQIALGEEKVSMLS